MYEISDSALQLGLIGLIRFLPSLGLSLIAGAFADSHNHRHILLVTQSFSLLAVAILFVTSLVGVVTLPLIYGVVLLIALASAFEGPTRNAIIPALVTRDVFTNAFMISSALFPVTAILGPALAGLLIATYGPAGAYGADVAVMVVSLLTILLLRPRPFAGQRRKVSLAAIREGVQFVFRRQPVLGSMTLDMFAVIFAGATALLPIYAKDILEVGPRGYGLLTASQPVGALMMSLVLVVLPPVRNAGRLLLVTVGLFGLATAAFGLSRSFPLSLAVYALTGITDQISVVMRQNIIQLSTPDELRGRVSSVDSLFIGASNEIGAVESGFVAAAWGATFAVVSGGLACIAVTGAVTALMPELRRYQMLPHLAEAEREGQAAPAVT